MSDIDTASAAFIAAATKMGLTAEQVAAGLSSIASRMGATSSQLGKLAANIESAAAGSRAQGAASRQAGLELNKVISSARAAARSQEEFRDSANRAANAMVDSVSDPRLKASIRRYADAQIDAADRAETFRNAISMASKPIGAMGNIASSTFSAYQGANSGLGTSAALLQEAVKAAGGGMSGLGGVVQSLGTAIIASGAAAGGFQRRLLAITGGALALFGSALSLGGAALSALGTSVLPKLQAEIEKQITSFMSLSTNGAVFAHGLDEMIYIAGEAKLTLAQLDSIVKINKKTFAELGVGVSEGLQRVTNVMAAGGDNLRKGLFKLGYTVEEQAGLIADVMKDMRQTGRALPQDTNTTELIKEQTGRYAENLRIIANITGEDAKKKMEEARQAATNLAFQQELAGMSETQRRGAVEAMAMMSQAEKQAFMEFTVNGQAMTQETALFISQNRGAARTIEESIQSLNAGTLDAREQARINARNAEQGRQDALDNRALGRAGIARTGGPAQAAAEQQQRYLQDVLTRGTPEEVERQIAAAQQQANQAAGSRTAQMAEALNANQNLNVQIQKSINEFGVLDAYLVAASAATNLFIEGLKDVTDFVRDQIRPRQTAALPVPGELTEAETARMNPVQRLLAQQQRSAEIAAVQAENARRAAEQRSTTQTDQSRTAYEALLDARRRADRLRQGAPTSNTQQGDQPAAQQTLPTPTGNAAPAGTSTGPRADLRTPEGQRQAAADYFRAGLTVQPVNPNGTSLPPNPDAATAARQAVVAAETAQQERLDRINRDQIDERDAQDRPTQRTSSLPAQETPTQRTLHRLATTMDSVNDAITQSLEKLASIESNTRRTATNTG